MNKMEFIMEQNIRFGMWNIGRRCPEIYLHNIKQIFSVHTSVSSDTLSLSLYHSSFSRVANIFNRK